MQGEAKWYDDLPVQNAWPTGEIIITGHVGEPMTFEWRDGDVIGISTDLLADPDREGHQARWLPTDYWAIHRGGICCQPVRLAYPCIGQEAIR